MQYKVYTVFGPPVPKPTMTRADKWKTGPKARPCVGRYREYCDRLRKATGGRIECSKRTAISLDVIAYMPIPDSWPKKKRAAMAGKPHCQRPDRSNLLKAIEDALFQDDAAICDGRTVKLWDDGHGPRTFIELFIGG